MSYEQQSKIYNMLLRILCGSCDWFSFSKDSVPTDRNDNSGAVKMTMKFDAPSQDARLNADFANLSGERKEAVLSAIAKARKTLGVQNVFLQNGDEAYAYKRPGDGKIAWGINSSGTGYCNTRGVFPE